MKETKAEIRNKLVSLKTILETLSKGYDVPENLVRIAQKDIEKIIELLKE